MCWAFYLQIYFKAFGTEIMLLLEPENKFKVHAHSKARFLFTRILDSHLKKKKKKLNKRLWKAKTTRKLNVRGRPRSIGQTTADEVVTLFKIKKTHRKKKKTRIKKLRKSRHTKWTPTFHFEPFVPAGFRGVCVRVCACNSHCWPRAEVWSLITQERNGFLA